MEKYAIYIRNSNIYDDSRATKEIRALLRTGVKVQVLGWGRDPKALDNCKKVFKENKENIDLNFYDVNLDNGIGFQNIDKLLGWFSWIREKTNYIDSKHNVSFIHTCNLDCGLPIASFCKKNKIPLIYDIFDYYIDSHSIPPFLRPLIERLEISVINKSMVTIICSENRKEQIKKASPKEVLVVHNSPDIPDKPETQVNYDYAYCGTFRDKRLLEGIFQRYPSHSDLKFAMAGNGSLSKEVVSLSSKYPNFYFFGSIPYDEVLNIEAQANCISAIYDPSLRNHRLCAPNKFYEALALGKPVIVCRGTGIDEIVEKENIGIVINFDENEFYEAVYFLKKHPNLCIQMGQRARKIYIEKYKWSIMEKKLNKVYQKFIEN